MTKCKLIGVKQVSGTSKKTSKPFNFVTAILISDMCERDVQNGAWGQDVHNVIVPDHAKDVLVAGNIGKEFEIQFYYAGRSEGVGYAALCSSK